MSWATMIEDCRDAADWAYCTCVEYSCGYSQPDRTRISEGLLRAGEAETDCSAGVSWWLWKGGLLGECPWFSTHTEREYLADAGFELLDPAEVAPARNDVLWRRGHTALYIGEGLQAEAVRTERGDAGYGGSEPGDQDGGETVARPYDPGAWEQILRPPAGRGPQVTGTWLREGDRWWYQYADGSWPTGWASVEGSWYLFDGRGWMLTGWQEVGGLWYLLNPEHDGAYGAMLTGWQQVGGRWYWMDEDGAMATGWREVEGKWRFFDAGGAMVGRGFARHGDAWYALGPGGAMVEGGTLSVGEDGRIAFGG